MAMTPLEQIRNMLYDIMSSPIRLVSGMIPTLDRINIALGKRTGKGYGSGYSADISDPRPMPPVQLVVHGKTVDGESVSGVIVVFENSERNLVIDDYAVKDVIIGTDGVIKPATNYQVTMPVPVKPSTTYTCDYKRDTTSNDPLRIGFYDEDMNLISRPTLQRTTTLTSPSNAKYARFSYGYTSNIAMYDVQFEEGSTPSEYSEFDGTLIEIDIDGHHLASLGDDTDTLTIDRYGNAVITQVVGGDATYDIGTVQLPALEDNMTAWVYTTPQTTFEISYGRDLS